jgi:drug/metabolite transporter (DMT)-like permease
VPIGIAAALMAALTYGAVAAVQAAVIRRHGLRSLMMVVVLIGYLVGWALHLVAIDHLPLYLAQVIVSSSLVVTAVIAAFVLGEPLRREHWAAVVAMVLGLSLLAMASGRVGSSDFDSTTTMELYVVTGVLGWLTWRWQHPISGVVLGILSGVAYGISPIGSRTLIDFNWDHLNSYATALSIGFSGALGFLLYSFAFQRTSVTAATAPESLLQTVIPAVVGITLFHDQVRVGWWPTAAVAFAVAVAAGVVLCGAEARLDLLDEELAVSLGDATEGVSLTDRPTDP